MILFSWLKFFCFKPRLPIAISSLTLIIMLETWRELQTSSNWLIYSETGCLPCLCLACVLLTVSWGQWNCNLGLIFILSWIISENDKAWLSLQGKQHEAAGQVTIWPSAPFGKKIFLCGLQLQLHAYWVLSVTGCQNSSSQGQMGGFISTYGQVYKHLCWETSWDLLHTVLLNAKNYFGRQLSKIWYIFWSGVSWKENVTTRRKDHKAQKGQETQWEGGQRKPTIKKCYFPCCITSSSPLVFLTHHKGQSWEHCSVHHFAVNFVYVTITLKWTYKYKKCHFACF